jgi:Zn-dependent peptidase ImmA (M78 family)
LLRSGNITSAPVDVESVARRLGILVRRTPTDDDISGFLLRHPGGQAIIGVNTLHHPNRQRFTIAHEIGHFILHQQQVHIDRAVVKLRDRASSQGDDDEEVEANGFAAELLMPVEFLGRDLERLPPTDFHDDRRMQQLAKSYLVSVQAMTNRLVILGFLPELSH